MLEFAELELGGSFEFALGELAFAMGGLVDGRGRAHGAGEYVPAVFCKTMDQLAVLSTQLDAAPLQSSTVYATSRSLPSLPFFLL